MIPNMTVEASRALTQAAARDPHWVYTQPGALKDLVALGLVHRVTNHQAKLTEQGVRTAADLEKLRPAEDALWARLLKEVAALPNAGSTSRSTGSFEHTDGASVGRCRYTEYQGDGTRMHWDLTATLRGGRITVSSQTSVDSCDDSWGPGGRMDLTDPRRRVVVAHEHYMLGPDRPRDNFKGFGGRRWEIEFHDGRRVTTHDLWYQGVIPPKWRDRYPDNARFV